MSNTMQEHAGEYAVRGGPGAIVGGLALGGIQLSDVVLILTAIYTFIQIAAFSYQFYQKNFKKNGSKSK